MPHIRTLLIWGALLLAAAIPLVAAGQSPLLAWRSPVYIAAGFAGVMGLVLILLQPLLIAALDLELESALNPAWNGPSRMSLEGASLPPTGVTVHSFGGQVRRHDYPVGGSRSVVGYAITNEAT